MIVYALQTSAARKFSRPLLAAAVQDYFHMELPAIQLGAHGKPYFPSRPDCQFNISHSGDLLVCALARYPVGVDIQTVKPHSQRLLDRVCSEAERAWLRGYNDDPAAFAKLWTLKESRCKQSGRGLTMPISQLTIPLPAAGETSLILDSLAFSLISGIDWEFCLCSVSGTEDKWDGVFRYVTLENGIILK